MKKDKSALICILAAICAAGIFPCSARAELIWNGREWVEPRIPDRGTPEGDLVVIRRMVEMGQNDNALDAVEQFLVNHYESPSCEEALNLAGQSLFNDGDYWESYEWYERQIAEYPNGVFYLRALDREYRIGDAYLNGRKRKFWKIFRLPATDEGVDILTQIAARAPVQEIGEKSLIRIADHYFEEEVYVDAVAFYDRFVEGYPRSSRRSYAMYRAAEACLLSYRGVEFDKTPLLKARLRFRTYAAAFPMMARQKKVAGILREIDSSLAHKLFNMGEFYERVGRPGAALYCYRRVVREYPGTEWAETARGIMPEVEVGRGGREAPPLIEEELGSGGLGDEIVPIERTLPPVKPGPVETAGKDKKDIVGAGDDMKNEPRPLDMKDILLRTEKEKGNSP